MKSYALLLICMISWGISNPLADYAVVGFSPVTLTMIECLVGFTFLLVVKILRHRKFMKIEWRYMWWIGLIQPFAAWLLGNLGYRHATASTGVIILASEAIFSLLVARLWLAHKLSGFTLTMIALGIAGVGLAAGGSLSLSADSGTLFFILSAILFGIYSTATRRFLMESDPFEVALTQTMISAIAALALYALLRPESAGVTPHMWWAAIASGLFGISLPFVAFNYLSARLPSKVTASALNLIPVAGVLASGVLGRGTPTAIQTVGGVLVLVSVFGVSRADKVAS